MRWFFARGREEHGEDTEALRLQAERARMLVEESREMLLVLDAENRVIAASRRAREALDGVAEGRPAPKELLEGDARSALRHRSSREARGHRGASRRRSAGRGRPRRHAAVAPSDAARNHREPRAER